MRGTYLLRLTNEGHSARPITEPPLGTLRVATLSLGSVSISNARDHRLLTDSMLAALKTTMAQRARSHDDGAVKTTHAPQF